MTDRDRNARLAALSSKAGRSQPLIDAGGGENDQAAAGESASSSKPTLSFRNYVPKDASLSAAAPLDDDDDGIEKFPTGKRQRRSDQQQQSKKSALELALARTSRESREAAGQNVGAGGWGSVTPVATRKVNWDLKRDVQSKMEKLERRTQRAIVGLWRERLEREAAEGGGDDGGEGDSDLD
jgi:coiled-coil domain-containing protein 12